MTLSRCTSNGVFFYYRFKCRFGTEFLSLDIAANCVAVRHQRYRQQHSSALPGRFIGSFTRELHRQTVVSLVFRNSFLTRRFPTRFS